jgi:hypothetical protein
MTTCRHILGLLVSLLLFAAPAATPALPSIVAQPGTEDDDEGGIAERTFAVEESLHGQRTVERHRPTARQRSAVIPPHGHHAIPVRPQFAPVPFAWAVNSPLHC